MLAWLIQISIISIIFIFIVHNLIGFFKSTLTVPKIKDLVNTPSQKYQHIFDTITHKDNKNVSYTELDLLPTDTSILSLPTQTSSMKDELKTFLKKQFNNENENNIIGIDSLSGNSFSTF
jgi:hypothetical protein